MKTIGMIGGIGPESTIEYYRLIIASYVERVADGSYPLMIINSIDLKKLRTMAEANQRTEMTEYLVSEIHKLARAKADFGFLAANTPHMVFDGSSRSVAHSADQHCGDNLPGREGDGVGEKR